MPIKHDVKIKTITENDFYSIDHKIMNLAFIIHNELGRFYDEKIYQNELAYRCRDSGIRNVMTEVPIQISYHDFSKFYYVDLLINNSIVYELKTVRTLIGEHQKQALNYLFLLGLNHGKLLNLRSHKIEHRFVSTRLTPKKRYQFIIEDSEWMGLDEDSFWLRQFVENLLVDWGAFLETNVFYDAIYYFRSGEDQVVRTIKVLNDSRLIGIQRLHLLNPDIAFKISAVTKNLNFYEIHLRRFIKHSALKGLQWINFNHNNIVFKTLLN